MRGPGRDAERAIFEVQSNMCYFCQNNKFRYTKKTSNVPHNALRDALKINRFLFNH
jgi:predicted  nucleic acid-binding Zn-ribbon protein